MKTDPHKNKIHDENSIQFTENKLAFEIIVLVFLSLLVASCGPYHNKGYSVSISIDSSASPTLDDVKLITDFLKDTTFEVVAIEKEKSWTMESYKINLEESKFGKFEHKYVRFVVVYSFSNKLNDNQKLLDKIDIRIGNSWEGKEQILKKKINSIADHIIGKLEKRFSTSNFTVNRSYVTPI